MTVSTTASSAVFLGNGSTTVFSATINNGVPFNSNSSLAAYSLIYTDVNGNQTTLSPSVYSIAFTAAVTGALWGIGVQVTYPTAGSPIASGTSLTLNRIFPLQQLTSISNQGDFAPQNIEAMGDIEEMQIQQLAARTGQQRGTWASGVQYNSGDVVVDGPNGANTSNYYACVIPNTSGTWSADLAVGDWALVINVQIIEGYATSAAANAAIATAEAGTATAQAVIATTEAGIATTQATNAAASASSASTSASTATTQAGIATTGATTATAQAVIATTQAGTATTEAGIATTEAGIATTQATNAAASAAAAAASALAAGGTLTATSTTSNTIGTGNFTFTTQANKNFFMGQNIIAASNANGANYIHGYVNSYSGTTLIITETDNGGSGTHADWNISVSGTQGTSGGGTGSVTTVSVATANGVSGSVANPTTTPAITLTLGAITPTTIVASSTVSGTQITSTVSTGTAPLVVSSTTPVTNLSIGGNAATVTTNANLTGPITSVGNATSIASQTGTGSKIVVDTSPTLITPILGAASGTSLILSGLTASSAVATNGSKQLVSVTNTGTGNNVLATSPTLVTPALGTPSSGNLANCTGIPVPIMTALGVGAVIMANFSGTIAAGATTAGSNLIVAFGNGVTTGDGNPSGTWQSLQSYTSANETGLWQRVS